MRYYVEFGANNRVFVNNPPLCPQGKIVEISESDWKKIKGTHPSLWKMDGNRVKVGLVSIRPRMKLDVLKLVVMLILGFILGRL